MHIKVACTLFSFLWLVQAAVAAELQKEDFAFGYHIDVGGAGAVYSVPLSYEVYQNSVWDNLADIRVFNGKGEVVPHELRHAETIDRHIQVRVNVPFFPLSSESISPDDDVSIEVQRSLDGEIVGIARKGSVQQPASSYLLDLRQAGPYPLSLHLEWRADGTGVLSPVTMSSSDNLLDWRRIGRGTLADLLFMGNRIRHRNIVLYDNPGKYLRITLEKGGEAVRLTGVQAVSDGPDFKRRRSWVDLPLRQASEQGEMYLRADLAGTLPVDGLQLRFRQPNSLLQVRIETRVPGEPWRYQDSALFYQLQEDDITLTNEPLEIGRKNIRFFRMEVLRDGTGGQTKPPTLKVGYLSHDLLFIARGSGPFVLAYGNGRLKGGGPGENRSDLHGLAGEQNRSIVRRAVLTDKIVLGGTERLEKKEETPWEKIVLVVVLLSGAAVLAAMFWSLVKKKQDR